MKKALMLLAMILGTTAMVSAQAKPAKAADAKTSKAATQPVKEVKAEEAIAPQPVQAAQPVTEAVPVEVVKPTEENQKRSKS